ncbi:hypothetical protein Cadr_000015698 [Camelus dromedarius]|uniref:Uncharacterized protein n=1 Tax=Camelus dromedarius TaxID=9838 RepID=A0A5N4E8E1_CAMDR|nr:hypothetical protein Cadr_000015698 [Camelus dromedarius]
MSGAAGQQPPPRALHPGQLWDLEVARLRSSRKYTRKLLDCNFLAPRLRVGGRASWISPPSSTQQDTCLIPALPVPCHVTAGVGPPSLDPAVVKGAEAGRGGQAEPGA